MIIEKYGDVSKRSRSKRLKATCPDCGCRVILDEEDYKLVGDLAYWNAFDSRKIVYATVTKWHCPCCDKDVKSETPTGGPFSRLLGALGIAKWYSQCDMAFKSVIPIGFIYKYRRIKNLVTTTETLLDAETNKEIAKINDYKDASEQSVKESVINGIIKGINNEVENGNTRYYVDYYTNEQINKYFERKEIRKIFENAGYLVYFKYYFIDDISIAYISWR